MNLVQILRGYRYPVPGAKLAAELGVSLRTLYRDIAALQQQGASIDGEPGLGYMLRPGFLLPPLMFTEDEIEALVLGSRWVAGRTDPRLRAAGRNALIKIAAVLPDDLRRLLHGTTLLAGPPDAAQETVDVAELRAAIRSGRKASIRYRDLKDVDTQRTVWPFALAYFDRARVLAAWCETRRGFRHFRADRILSLEVLAERYPRSRQSLLAEWREAQGIPNADKR